MSSTRRSSKLDFSRAGWRDRPDRILSSKPRRAGMRANRVRDVWKAGRAVINGWCGIPSGFSAELMAHLGWDSLVVDMQHGVVDYQVMVSMFQGISTTDVTPMVRVPWNDPAHIMKALDA